MRRTLQSWWCGNCSTKNTPDQRNCSKCNQSRIERHAQIHQSDRAVVYYNPVTGEHRTPPRVDMDMPEVYANAGFERKEILSMTEWERQSGSVHEATNFSSGNEPGPPEPPQPKHNPQVIESLAREMASAIASGPITGGDKLI